MKTDLISSRIHLVGFFLFFLLLAISLGFSFCSKIKINTELKKLEKKLNALIKENKKRTSDDPLHVYFKIPNKIITQGLKIVPNLPLNKNKDTFSTIIENGLGIFIVDFDAKKDTSEIFLTKIYSHYPIQNQYFQNEAHPFLNSPYKLILSLKKGTYVVDINHIKIYVDFEIEYDANKSLLAWILWLASVGVLLWIAYLKRKLMLFFSIGILIMFIALQSHALPQGYYQHILYDVHYFSSNFIYLKHAGDILSFAIFILLAGFWYRMIFENSTSSKVRMFFSFGIIILIFALTSFYVKSNENLIQPDHSSDFDAVSFIIIFTCWTTMAIWLWNLLTDLKEIEIKIHKIWLWLIFSVAFCVYYYAFFDKNIFITSIFLIVFFIPGIFFLHGNSRIGFTAILLFASWTITALIIPNNREKSARLIDEFAIQKLTDRDEALEGEFLEVPDRLANNASILNLIAFPAQEEILELLKKNIFYGYFRKYEICFSLFNKDCVPEWKTDFLLLQNLDALKELFQTHAESTMSEYLKLVRWPDGNKYYLSILPIKDKTLVCLFIPLPVGEAGTILDLFSDMRTARILKKSSAEFAIYKNGILTENSGLNELPVIQPNRFSAELKLIKSESQTLVARMPPTDVAHYIKIFFLILTTHGILLSIVLLIGYAMLSGKGILSLKFKEKLLLFFIFSITLILTVIFVFVRKNIDKEFKEQHFAYLKEKTSILKKVISDLMENDFDFTIMKDPLDFVLKKFSFENGIDVIYYDKEGIQQLTTLDKLNEFGVKMYVLPEHISKLLSNGLLIYNKEYAGKMNYYCAYLPLVLRDGKSAGFLALPYFPSISELFKRQDRLVNEVVNLLLILLIPAIVLSALLASYIVRPLQILSSRLVSNKAIWEGEKLEWKSEDEIGTMVNAYNQMLEQLKESIAKLSEQERESAWREMARQIAHEIKNPLTPIRLNIQHLMYLFKKSPNQFNEKFVEASEAILHQIDALTSIANEFSHFAKISNEPFEMFDLNECIKSVISLYHSTPGLKISSEAPVPMPVLGNKNQLTSVLNNLFENAREALSGRTDAEISIIGEITENNIILRIRDNGPGIPPEIRKNLFTPYFTTKSSGTGLGLAIAKRIMQHHGGDIVLEDSENGGACFKLIFPLKK